MEHQPTTTMAILGSDTVVGRTLSLLLEGHGYNTILLDSYPTGVVDELLEGAHLLLLTPRVDDGVREAFLVHFQNRCRVRRYSGNHETSHLRPFTFGHRKRALGKRPTLQGRFRHAPSPDHPRQQQG